MFRKLAPLMVFLVAGCTAVSSSRQMEEVGSDRIVWPGVPEKARIEFLYSFSKPADLGLRESISRKLRDLFTGSDDRGMARPYSISARNEQIAVADPGLGTIHLFDTKNNRYRRLSQAGSSPLVSPVGVAIGDGRIYVADSVLGSVFIFDSKDRLIKEIPGFGRPTGLVFHPANQRLYVADTVAHQIMVFDENGLPMSKLGKRGAGEGEFNYPTHLAVGNDRLLVNDTMNFRVQSFSLDGEQISTFGKHGDGSGSFAQPKGIGVDPDGHIYIADAMANQVQIFDRDGLFLLGFGGSGTGPGNFHMPAGIAMDNDLIYVADSFNQRVQVFRYLGNN